MNAAQVICDCWAKTEEIETPSMEAVRILRGAMVEIVRSRMFSIQRDMTEGNGLAFSWDDQQELPFSLLQLPREKIPWVASLSETHKGPFHHQSKQ